MSLTPFLRHLPNEDVPWRLFCFPHAGGGTAFFLPWRRQLPDWIDLCPVQLPARERRFRESAYISMDRLVGDLANELQPYLHRPFVLLGYSLGGLVAFEFAGALRAREMALPSRLFACAVRAPHCLRALPPVHQLPDREFLEELARRYDGLRPEVLSNQMLMKLALPSLRGDFTLLETYRYREQPPLPLAISALAGSEDSIAPPADVRLWSEHCDREFTFREFPGSHFFVHEQRKAFLAAIAADLAEL